jgi:ABC-type transporter Mla MlaB component
VATSTAVEPKSTVKRVQLDGNTMRLSGRLTVADARPLQSAAIEWLRSPGELTCDLTQVVYGDACTLQLLAAIENGLQTAGRRANFLGPASILRDAWRAGGFVSTQFGHGK